jgi:hypothetical protein
MTVTYRPAKRERIPLLLGVVGGTGSGKTMSALRLARGIAGGQPFAGLDTENGRMLHYADQFPELQHARLDAPFRPERYAEAIEAADAQALPVVIVDSMSHEWAGDGGILDWQLDEYQRLGSRDAVKLLSWSTPKQAHKRMVTRLLQVHAHVILCFRAEPKVEMVKGTDGKMEIVPSRRHTGLDGWVPIAEANLPYELTASLLLMADQPGIPRPIKLEEQHRPLVPLDQRISEETGAALREWAEGGAPALPADSEEVPSIEEMTARLTELAGGNAEEAAAIIAKHRAANDDGQHAAWLVRQLARAATAASTG